MKPLSDTARAKTSAVTLACAAKFASMVVMSVSGREVGTTIASSLITMQTLHQMFLARSQAKLLK